MYVNYLVGEVSDVRMSRDEINPNFLHEEAPRIMISQAFHPDSSSVVGTTAHVSADIRVPRREDDLLVVAKWHWQTNGGEIKPLPHIIKEQQEFLWFQRSGNKFCHSRINTLSACFT